MAACDQMTSCQALADTDKWAHKIDHDTDSETTGEEMTPTTTVSEADSSDIATESDMLELPEEQEPEAPQLGPGLYHDDVGEFTPPQQHGGDELAPAAGSTLGGGVGGGDGCCEEDEEVETDGRCESSSSSKSADPEGVSFTKEETLFVFDWDGTILPSSWIQSQGLRLDGGSVVNALQRERLAELAPLVAETLCLAKQHGTVVLVTNAERGWIELSCQKFLPTILPLLENLRMVSARTTYEGPRAPSPLDWKLRAFDVEIERVYGFEAMEDATVRKNVLSLGDGAHEREAVMRSTQSLPNCSAKSLKFVERPDISQIVKQHTLISGCFDQIVQHEGNLDLCIRCE
mmetsp:Transcript_25072/g.71402  ORF Transcript_25072/g.71402 Transcript_25072/m.71402 type:complete len:346 (-) Transcript_25072:97-1134(-)